MKSEADIRDYLADLLREMYEPDDDRPAEWELATWVAIGVLKWVLGLEDLGDIEAAEQCGVRLIEEADGTIRAEESSQDR